MPRTHVLFTCAVCTILFLTGCGGGSSDDPDDPDPPGGGETVSFALDILPIFQQECTTCHGGAGGLNLESYQGLIAGGDSGAVIVPRDPAASLLPKRLDGSIPPQMPLNENPLSGPEIDRVEQWILEGALDN